MQPKLKLLRVTSKTNEQSFCVKEQIMNKPIIHFKLERDSLTQLQSVTLEKEKDDST